MIHGLSQFRCGVVGDGFGLAVSVFVTESGFGCRYFSGSALWNFVKIFTKFQQRFLSLVRQVSALTLALAKFSRLCGRGQPARAWSGGLKVRIPHSSRVLQHLVNRRNRDPVPMRQGGVVAPVEVFQDARVSLLA